MENLQSVGDVTFDRAKMRGWTLPRNSGGGVAGYAFRGTITRLAGIDLGRPIVVLGYNHNIQSSFGVTAKVKSEIRNWFAAVTKEVASLGPADRADRVRINGVLADFHATRCPLPGIQTPRYRDVYVTQLLESMRARRQGISPSSGGDQSIPRRADPASDLFEPHKGAAFQPHRASSTRHSGRYSSPSTSAEIRPRLALRPCRVQWPRCCPVGLGSG